MDFKARHVLFSRRRGGLNGNGAKEKKMARSKKCELSDRMFAHRTELNNIADGRHDKANEETVTIDEVVSFLQMSASNHKRVYRYTNIDRVKEILSSKRLALSRLLEMNDLREFQDVKDADRTYIACFSFGELENMAMWWMYGRDSEKSVRISFNNQKVGLCVARLKDKEGVFRDPDGKEPMGAHLIDTVSYHDIAYVYGKALMWNHKVVGMSRCRKLDYPKKQEELHGFIKDYGWSSENEVRLMVKLKKCDPDLKRIFIDFSEAVKSMEVLTGPVNDKHTKIKGLLSMYDVKSVEKSQASVIF